MQPAIVIGLCSHGLAICRTLHSKGVEVVGVESDTRIAGCKTKTAQIVTVDNINDDLLVESLLDIHSQFGPGIKPIVFPTNDKMVEILARGWSKLDDFYTLSWSECADFVSELQKKSALEHACEQQKLWYPKSRNILSAENLETAIEGVEYPLIVKPVHPMSSFKVALVNNLQELEKLVEEHSRSLPFVAQQWIEGDDSTLVFCSMVLDKGEVLASFTGRKLQAFPPAMGQGTIMEPFDDEKTKQYSKQFFANSNYTGPASVEFKIGPDGRYWVIEPNMGRTEFSVQCALSNNVDLVYSEYLLCNKQDARVGEQSNSHIWFDTEKDLTAYSTKIFTEKSFKVKGKKPVFPYLNLSDPKPFYFAFKKTVRRVLQMVVARVSKSKNGGQYEISKIDDCDELESILKAIPASDLKNEIFLSYLWFSNYIASVANVASEKVFFLLLKNKQGESLAILPLCESAPSEKVSRLTSLSNYYSPIFDLVYDSESITRKEALAAIFEGFRREFKRYDIVDIFPMYSDAAENFKSQNMAWNLRPTVYLKSGNWFHEFTDEESFYAGLSQKIKNTIRRKSNKLGKEKGYTFHYYTSADELDLGIAEYEMIYDKSWKESEPFPSFIREFVRSFGSISAIRLGSLKIDGIAVAAQIWILNKNEAYIYKLAYDPEFKNYSVGTILTNEMCKKCIQEENVTVIDFLTGDDKFKKDWMLERRSLVGVQWANMATFRGMLAYLANSFSSIREHR